MKTKTPSTKKLTAFIALGFLDQWRAFLKYVQSRPKNLKYDYSDTLNCPKAQFGKHLIHGSRKLHVSCGSSLNFRVSHLPVYRVLEGLDASGACDVPFERAINEGDRTFGQLAKRLEKLLS